MTRASAAHSSLVHTLSTPAPHRGERAVVDDLWEVIPPKCDRSGNLFDINLGQFQRCGGTFTVRKFVFIGPVGGDGWLRLGLFAGMHGDEPAGCHALVWLLASLHEEPIHAQGLELHVYPVCNPSGYEDRTRWARGGPDLNREFWINSSEPEVRLLESQMTQLQFDGIVALHSDDTCEGVYGYTGGEVLNRNLLLPALEAAAAFLPCCDAPLIDGWSARDGLIDEGYPGILSASPEQNPRPFELIFETPARADLARQVEAHHAALLSIFNSVTSLRSHAANI